VGRVTQAKCVNQAIAFPATLACFAFVMQTICSPLEQVQFQEDGSSMPLSADNKATYPQTLARNLQNRGILARKPIHLGREKS
jgi:hypothetical protein